MTTSTTEKSVQTKTTRPRSHLLWGSGAMLVFIAFAASVAPNPEHPFTQGMDDAWRALVGAGPGAESGPLSQFFQQMGAIPGFVLMLLVLPIFLVIVRRWRSALYVLAGLVGSTVVAQVTKNLVDRPRPAEDLENGLYGPLVMVDHGSLPSGHGVTAGFIIVAIAALIPAAHRWIWWIASVLIAVGMVWQRTYINAHWLSDAIIGVVGGVGSVLLIWWLFEQLLAKDRGRPFRRPAKVNTEGTFA